MTREECEQMNYYDEAMLNIRDSIDNLVSASSNEAYVEGIKEAWEFAIAINDMDGYEVEKIFGKEKGPFDYPPIDAIKMLKDYKKNKNILNLEIGDEVENSSGGKSVVVEICDDFYRGITEDAIIVRGEIRCAKKTGRHFEQFKEALK